MSRHFASPSVTSSIQSHIADTRVNRSKFRFRALCANSQSIARTPKVPLAVVRRRVLRIHLLVCAKHTHFAPSPSPVIHQRTAAVSLNVVVLRATIRMLSAYPRYPWAPSRDLSLDARNYLFPNIPSVVVVFGQQYGLWFIWKEANCEVSPGKLTSISATRWPPAQICLSGREEQSPGPRR